MNIGISTVHFAHNYGAMLQGYALKTYLEQQGHYVTMTDRRYVKEPNLPMRKPFPCNNLKAAVLYPKYLLKWYFPPCYYLKKRWRAFDSFLKQYLNNTKCLEAYDTIIYGSDQIWSKFPNRGYDRIWWGLDNLKAKRRISYAASMGAVDIADKKDEDFIRQALSRFDDISVRESDLKAELESRHLADTTIYQTIDPTFLLTKEDWDKITPKRIIHEPYLLFYDFQIDEETTNMVNRIAKEKNLRVIRLTNGVVHSNKDADYFRTAGPLQFLSLIKYADFVFSSSFHGVAFSLIFRKQFAVRQIWNVHRVKSLLAMCGLSHRFLEKYEDPLADIKFDMVNDTLSTLISQSKEYLHKNIDDIFY